MYDPKLGDKFIEEVTSHPEVRQLVTALTLSARFHFYILVCGYPIVAGEILKVLEKEIPAKRNESVTLIRLNPYDGRKDSTKALRPGELWSSVLMPLVAPSLGNAKHGVIHFVDASHAVEADDEAWGQLFQRMNEQRNSIVQKLQGELILCVPDRLEMIFTRAAPDFWSIRSSTMRVPIAPPLSASDKTPDRNEYSILFVPPNGLNADDTLSVSKTDPSIEPPSLATGLPQQEMHTLRAHAVKLSKKAWSIINETEPRWLEAALLLNTVLKDRQRICELSANSPAHPQARYDLARAYSELGELARRQGDLAKAWNYHHQTRTILSELVKQHSDQIEWQHELRVALDRICVLHRDRSELDEAQTLAQEAVSLARKINKQQPLALQSRHLLVASLERLGSICHLRRDYTAAVIKLSESLRVNEDIVGRYPEFNEGQRFLPRVMNKLGDARRALGEFEEARSMYDKALALRRQLLQQHPGDMQLLNGLSVSLDRMGDMFMLGGDYGRAEAAYQESIKIMKEQLTASPSDFVIMVNKLGKVYCARGNWAEAENAYSMAIDLMSTPNITPEAAGLRATVQAGLENAKSQKNKYEFTPAIYENRGPQEQSHLIGLKDLFAKQAEDLSSEPLKGD